MGLLSFCKKNIDFAGAMASFFVQSATRRRLAGGAFWGGVGGAGSKIITLAASYILARILGQNQFGEYGIVFGTVSAVSALGAMGVGSTAVKYVSEYKYLDKDKVGRIVTLTSYVTWISSVVSAVTLVLVASWLAEKTLAAPHLATTLKISAISVAMGIVNVGQTSILTGLEAFKSCAIINIFCGAFQAVAVIVGALNFGLNGAITGLAIASSVSVLLNRLVLSKKLSVFRISPSWREYWQEWPVLVNFSLPAFLMSMIAGPVVWAGNAILANQVGGYNEVGIYNATLQWFAVVSFLPGILVTAAMPIMSEKFGHNDLKSNRRIFVSLTVITAVIVVPIVLIISILSKLIMRGYGATFEKGYCVLILAVMTSAISSIITPGWYAIIASGKMWICFFLNVGWSILFLILAMVLIKHGAEGLASARLISYAIYGLSVFWYSLRLSDQQRESSATFLNQ